MPKKYSILLVLLLIWLIASGFIAWQGQFISGYLVYVRGMTQAEYEYPTDGVLFCIFIYLIVIINYAVLFMSKFSQQHPYMSYLLLSIIPVLMTGYAFLGAMHAPCFWDAFIVVMLLTFLLHFLLLPVLLVIYRKYISLEQ